MGRATRIRARCASRSVHIHALSPNFAFAACLAAALTFFASGSAWSQAAPSNGNGSAQPAATQADPGNATAPGPTRLRQAPRPRRGANAAGDNGYDPLDSNAPPLPALPSEPPEPDEFERFVSNLAGLTPQGRPIPIRRFGADLMRGSESDSAAAAEALPLVPNDYIVKPGDTMMVSLWGSVDAELDLVVDRSGRITIPRVGTVVVAGRRFGELTELIHRRVAQTFRNFDVSVSMGELRGVRVFVTGFVNKPGAHAVTSLATISQALQKAGGPSSAGSFRNVVLRRGGQTVVTLDLYELLVKGQRADDRTLQPDDVIHVGPVGLQVGMIGSVNRPAIFELKPGEKLRDVLAMAGGLSAVADTRRLTLETLADRDNVRVVELPLPESSDRVLAQGDVLRAVSAVFAVSSFLPQNKRIRVEGEVKRPGLYVLPPASTLQDAIAAAGGLTSAAFLFGTEFQRESVRQSQQENYDRALRDVERDFARAEATQRSTSAEEAASQAGRSAASQRLIQRLRELRPSGRVVLQLEPNATALPALALEDGDRLYVPQRGTTVGVFGSVFSTGNYLYGDSRTLGDYLRLAGGPTRGADKGSIFVIRANGSVVSESQTSGWFTRDTLEKVPAIPGDTVFVPEELNKSTILQNVKDWTQVLFQLGLGVAAFKSLGN
jgi:protein involved in polysaccharide export with SLBB domain